MLYEVITGGSGLQLPREDCCPPLMPGKFEGLCPLVAPLIAAAQDHFPILCGSEALLLFCDLPGLLFLLVEGEVRNNFV